MNGRTLDIADANWQAAPEADAVCAALMAGELVAVPTETVYGLAADATNGTACAKIFAAKGRPQFNPLISHVQTLGAALDHGVFDERALALAEAFWPGPLTLVVPKRAGSPISDLATAGLQTVALRVPVGPVMRFLAEKTGRPLAAPSANRSGKITLEGASPDMRPDAPAAPGMLTSHYAPDAAMLLNASEVSAGDGLLSFGTNRLPGAELAKAEFNLSPTGDLAEAAANLFRAMRFLDAEGVSTIKGQFIPSFGLGEAINDRLRRAAAPRD